MRKTVIGSEVAGGVRREEGAPLELSSLARVEVTSESSDFPVENVFSPESGEGWRASSAGPQTIRVVFDQPAEIRRVYLRFEEEQVARTQEFLLRWQSSEGEWRDALRQQWNFSPTGSTTEVEDVQLNLPGVAALELQIKPDIGNSHTMASLRQWLLY